MSPQQEELRPALQLSIEGRIGFGLLVGRKATVYLVGVRPNSGEYFIERIGEELAV